MLMTPWVRFVEVGDGAVGRDIFFMLNLAFEGSLLIRIGAGRTAGSGRNQVTVSFPLIGGAELSVKTRTDEMDSAEIFSGA